MSLLKLFFSFFFDWRFRWLSTNRSLLSCVTERTVTAFIWLHLPYIFFPSADWWVLTERMPLSRIPSLKQSRFQLLFFLFLSTESCFCCLPSLRVRDRHTSCIVCVWGCVHRCAGMHVYVCVHVCLCPYVCVYVRMCAYFSKAEAAFMSVPSVENGSASEGQLLSLHWASHSVPKSQMPLSDVGSLLFVHETTTENILYLWDRLSDLLHTTMWTWT